MVRIYCIKLNRLVLEVILKRKKIFSLIRKVSEIGKKLATERDEFINRNINIKEGVGKFRKLAKQYSAVPLKDQLKKQLDELVRKQLITKIDSSINCVSNLVITKKNQISY